MFFLQSHVTIFSISLPKSCKLKNIVRKSFALSKGTLEKSIIKSVIDISIYACILSRSMYALSRRIRFVLLSHCFCFVFFDSFEERTNKERDLWQNHGTKTENRLHAIVELCFLFRIRLLQNSSVKNCGTSYIFTSDIRRWNQRQENRETMLQLRRL